MGFRLCSQALFIDVTEFCAHYASRVLASVSKQAFEASFVIFCIFGFLRLLCLPRAALRAILLCLFQMPQTCFSEASNKPFKCLLCVFFRCLLRISQMPQACISDVSYVSF